MLHRIREAMKREPVAGLLAGTVVADETWIGGKPGNRHGRSRTGGKPTWAQEDHKTTVFSLVNTDTGEVRSHVVADVTGTSLRKVIADHVSMADTDLMTDSATHYIGIGKEFRSHESVNHKAHEYVRGHVTSNPAENFFSQLKRSLDGTHHRISAEHLPRYLAQFDFLYTYGREQDSDRMRRVIDNAAGRRLTYKPLTAK